VQSSAPLESGPDDGLHAVILAAAATCEKRDGGALGRIELEAAVGANEDLREPHLSVDIDFAYQGERRVMAALEVRVITRQGSTRTDELFRSVLQSFGGTGLTNLVADRGTSEGFDVTVSFGSKIPFLSDNLLLPWDGADPRDVEAFSRALTALGIRHRISNNELRVPRRQLGGRVTADAQLAAYRLLREAGLDAALYASRIPCTQAARIEASGPDDATAVLDIALSRGLTSGYVCTARDADEMQALLSRHLGIHFSSRSFIVTHSFGGGPAGDGGPPRRGLRWFRNAGKR